MSEVSELNKYLLAVETRTPLKGPQVNQAIVQQLLVDGHHLIDIIRTYKYTVDSLVQMIETGEFESDNESPHAFLAKAQKKVEELASIGSKAKWGA